MQDGRRGRKITHGEGPTLCGLTGTSLLRRLGVHRRRRRGRKITGLPSMIRLSFAKKPPSMSTDGTPYTVFFNLWGTAITYALVLVYKVKCPFLLVQSLSIDVFQHSDFYGKNPRLWLSIAHGYVHTYAPSSVMGFKISYPVHTNHKNLRASILVVCTTQNLCFV
jgi:hypothetical protein